KLVLKAILDAKGFQEAQASIKGLAGAANASAPPIEGLGKKTAGLTKELGGTRGATADLTRILMYNLGVTGAAGEAAKAAGVAFNVLAGATGGLNFAVYAFILAAALVTP